MPGGPQCTTKSRLACGAPHPFETVSVYAGDFNQGTFANLRGEFDLVKLVYAILRSDDDETQEAPGMPARLKAVLEQGGADFTGGGRSSESEVDYFRDEALRELRAELLKPTPTMLRYNHDAGWSGGI